MSTVTDKHVTDVEIIEAGAQAICENDIHGGAWAALNREEVRDSYRRMAEAAREAMERLAPDEGGWRARALLAEERERLAWGQKEDLAHQVIETQGHIEKLRRDNERLRKGLTEALTDAARMEEGGHDAEALRAQLAEARDTLIDAWHDGHGGGQQLREYLGMTEEEYDRFVGPGVTAPAPISDERLNEIVDDLTLTKRYMQKIIVQELPEFAEIVRSDSDGNVTGVKLIDGSRLVLSAELAWIWARPEGSDSGE